MYICTHTLIYIDLCTCICICTGEGLVVLKNADVATASAASTTGKSPRRCKFYASGHCRNGSSCSMTHVPRSGAAVPVAASVPSTNAGAAAADFCGIMTELLEHMDQCLMEGDVQCQGCEFLHNASKNENYKSTILRV